MRVRATKLDEYQFLTCLKHGLWGSRNARFKDWLVGDKLILLVGNTVAGVAKVSGPAFQSSTVVWDNGAYPHRLPITFTHVPLPENRPQLLGDLRYAFVDAFEGDWGLGLVNQWLMKPDVADRIIKLIEASPNGIAVIQASLEERLTEAKVKRDAAATKGEAKKAAQSARKGAATPALKATMAKRAQKVAVGVASTGVVDEPSSSAEASEHLRGQHALITLGKIVGCSVWVASNDRNKAHEGGTLGDGCLTKLPSLGLSDEATKAIGLIDVIWFSKGVPLCAFEVEATTTVYSGLLRMPDLVELVPALKTELFIVAPKAREEKVVRELSRPTFRRIGLSDVCRVISIEDLEKLVGQVKSLSGFVQPSIVSKIAHGLSNDFESAFA